MPIQLEAYTAWGIIRGTVTQEGRLADVLETSATLAVTGAELDRLDGRPPERTGPFIVPIDDLIAVVAPPDAPLPSVAAWHPLRLQAGPYELRGTLPSMRGLDPNRSLLRPGGTFTLLAHVQVVPGPGGPAGSAAPGEEHAALWINRYAVEAAVADLDLTVYFPGADVLVVSDEEAYSPNGV